MSGFSNGATKATAYSKLNFDLNVLSGKEKSFISAIFYYRNYDSYIEAFLDALIPSLEKSFEHFELICMNNDSTVDSIEHLKKIHLSKYGHIPMTIVTLPYCKSIDEAMAIGIDTAIGDFIYEFDSILVDYDVNLIKRVYDTCVAGKDIVMVCPDRKVTPQQKGYYALYNFGVEKDKKIYPARFKFFSRRAINRIEKVSATGFNSIPVINNCGLEVENIYYSPSGKVISYDHKEKKERINKGVESIIRRTRTVEKILSIGSTIFITSGLINVCRRNKAVASTLVILGSMGIFTNIIISAVKVELEDNRPEHLVRNIEKVMK